MYQFAKQFVVYTESCMNGLTVMYTDYPVTCSLKNCQFQTTLNSQLDLNLVALFSSQGYGTYFNETAENIYRSTITSLSIFEHVWRI